MKSKLAIVLLAFAATLQGSALDLRADDAATKVSAALDQMEQWIGAGANGQRWREFLGTADLRAQLAKGTAAEKQAVSDALARYSSGAAGLDQPRFVAVRSALESWLTELSRPTLEELPAAVRSAKDKFKGASEAEANAAKASLKKAVDALDRYLGKGANGQSWRTYLTWDALQAQLANQAAPDFVALDAVELKFGSGRSGLNLPQFAAVHRALNEYRTAGRTALDPQAQEQYAQQLEAMAAALEAHGKSPSDETGRTIGKGVDWLASRRQVPEIVAAVRQYYYQPNLLLQMSEPLVAVGLVRKVNEQRPVTDVILGTRISGTGHTTGDVTVDLVPSNDKAIVDSLFTGHTESRTVGLNGPARINSAGHTDFQARKRIFISDKGIVSPAATAAARTRSDTLGVSAGGRMATNVAQGRVAGSKRQAEAISADHAEDRVTAEINKEADPKIRDANKRYQTKIRQPLLDRAQFPARLEFRTTDSELTCVAVQAAAGQVGAPCSAPDIAADHSLALRLHETAINNWAAGNLAGEKIVKKEFQQDVKDLFGKLPEDWEKEEGSWEITFHNEQPITVQFDGNTVKVTLRIKRVEGVADSKTPWRISAEYKLEKTANGFKALRQGEQIEIEPLNEDAGGRSVAEKANVRRQFERMVFKKEYNHDGLESGGDWAKAGKLPLVHLLCEKNWLALAWVLP